MIKYHNAGNAGRDYSRLEVQSCVGYMVEFVVTGGLRTTMSVRLNTEQITHMHNALSQFLSTHGTDVRSMIEGTSL
jgi:hypothetical protein